MCLIDNFTLKLLHHSTNTGLYITFTKENEKKINKKNKNKWFKGPIWIILILIKIIYIELSTQQIVSFESDAQKAIPIFFIFNALSRT